MEQKYLDRFLAKLEAVKRAEDECWEWPWGEQKSRPKFYDGTGMRNIARLVWTLFRGPIPAGEGYHGTCVLHSCDNPKCVNPKHLFLGTTEQNNQDRKSKGRNADTNGGGNPAAKLTLEQAREARRRADAGEPLTVIAADLGVSADMVGRIKARKNWRVLDLAHSLG